MATDYDAPRVHAGDEPALGTDRDLAARTGRSADNGALGDDADPFEAELGADNADATGEDLTVKVLPKQADEFTCSVCYLVHHRSQRASVDTLECRDCAA